MLDPQCLTLSKTQETFPDERVHGCTDEHAVGGDMSHIEGRNNRLPPSRLHVSTDAICAGASSLVAALAWVSEDGCCSCVINPTFSPTHIPWRPMYLLLLPVHVPCDTPRSPQTLSPGFSLSKSRRSVPAGLQGDSNISPGQEVRMHAASTLEGSGLVPPLAASA